MKRLVVAWSCFVVGLAAAPAGAAISEVEITRDLAYGADPKLQALDVYRLPDRQGLPILVFIHGGGWSEGDKGRHPRKGEFFARQGFLYITLNYRLSPAVKHPAHVQDVARALAWVQRNAEALGGDPSRLYLLGHSAGAHLAALVTTDRRYLEAEGSSAAIVDGVVLLDGSGYDVVTRMKGARGWSREMFRNAFGDDPQVWDDASPLRQLGGTNGPPPFLLFHIEGRAPSRRQAQAFAKALRKAGGTAHVVPVQGRDHVTINRRLGLPGDPVTARLLTFLRGLEEKE